MMHAPTSSGSTVACRICGSDSRLRFTLPLAHDLQASYYECNSCGFLQSRHLDDPEALDRVYARANADDDPGAAFRQHCVAHRILTLAQAGVFGPVPNASALDVGSGSGFLPAFLADPVGFRSLGFDPYASPAFTPSRLLRDWSQVTAAGPFRLVTAVEVLEHFTDPVARISEIASVMDPERSFLYVTTDLYDGHRHGPDWHYLAPHTAQHCSFYSRRSLEILKERIGASALRCVGGNNEWLFVRGAHSEARIELARVWTKALRWARGTRYFG
jgi:hypothetical protein